MESRVNLDCIVVVCLVFLPHRIMNGVQSVIVAFPGALSAIFSLEKYQYSLWPLLLLHKKDSGYFIQ